MPRYQLSCGTQWTPPFPRSKPTTSEPSMTTATHCVPPRMIPGLSNRSAPASSLIRVEGDRSPSERGYPSSASIGTSITRRRLGQTIVDAACELFVEPRANSLWNWVFKRRHWTNQKSLSKLHYEAGPAYVIAQIEALLRQLHTKAVLNVPNPLQSARLFAALIKGSDLLIIARFDEARAEDDNEIESYCRSAVAMFVAAHGGNNHAGG